MWVQLGGGIKKEEDEEVVEEEKVVNILCTVVKDLGF
jgi:phosphoribosylformimino-5-aminoimidazole carboxamide ribonucleotide (ProFAR) isomerase